MHEREGPRKINTCPRIDEELWTFQVPTILALKMDLLIFFLTNFIFENRLKTYAKGGKYVQMLKYKGEFSLRENSMEGGFPIGIWRGHYEALCIENTLFFVPSNIHLLFGNRGPPSFIRERFDRFFFFLLWSILFKKQSIEEFQCLIYALWMLYILCNLTF